MKKVTLQDIADALNISRITVWKVFSNREGVSDDLKAKVISKALEMNYNVPEQFRTNIRQEIPSEQITISVTVSRPETSTFWMTIIHEIAMEVAKQNINLMYTYLPPIIPTDYSLPPSLTNGTIHGMIVLNVYDEHLIGMLSRLPIPKVFMDTVNKVPFTELNGDLILLEGKSCIAKITDAIIERGRKKIGFIGDINYAQTNYERYRGFVHAMEQHKISINQNYSLTGPIGINTYKEEIDDFLDRLTELPEAFICVSDFVASLLYQSLLKRGYQIPEDIAISGFDGNTEFQGASDFTTVPVQNHDLGIRLTRQILYRLAYPKSCYEITYIFSDVVFRKSTEF